MEPIYLDEIIDSVMWNPETDDISRANCKAAMKKFGKLLLERAADNAKTRKINEGNGYYEVIPDSITSVINDIKQ